MWREWNFSTKNSIGIQVRAFPPTVTESKWQKGKRVKNIKNPKIRTVKMDDSKGNRTKIYNNEGKTCHHTKMWPARRPVRICATILRQKENLKRNWKIQMNSNEKKIIHEGFG